MAGIESSIYQEKINDINLPPLAKGKNLTISTSVFSVPLPGNNSKTIPFEFSVKIVDIFEDMEKGREGYDANNEGPAPFNPISSQGSLDISDIIE